MSEISLDVTVGEAVHHQAQGLGRLEQRGDIAKDHARLGEIDHRADQGFDVEGVEGHSRRILAGCKRRSITAAEPFRSAALVGNQPSIEPPARAQS
jgi:hypothetical protein